MTAAERARKLATDLTTMTLHGPVPLKTTMELATLALELCAIIDREVGAGLLERCRQQSRSTLEAQGYKPNELQVKFRDGFYDPLLAELAICDALVEQGGIAAWPGDGVACVAQMIGAQAKQVEALRAENELLKDGMAMMAAEAAKLCAEKTADLRAENERLREVMMALENLLDERQWDFEDDGRGENNYCRTCGWSRRESREQFLSHKDGCELLSALTAARKLLGGESR